jgi:hypothetical protein
VNSYGGTANARPLIGLGAAGVLIVSFFLPWLTYLGQSVSLAEMAAKSSGGGWLTLLLLIGGAILAAVGAGLRASGSASVSGSRRALAICWVAGFGASLGGFALYLLDLSSYSSVSYFGYSYSTGLGAGFGVWLGLVAAVGGLIVGLVDMAAGRNESWGPAYGPSSAPPWSAPPAPTGWQNPAAVQPAAPAGAWAAAGSVGRISYVESGRASSLVVAVGDQVMVGRDADARIRLTDPKVSRRHLMVAWAGNGWSVRDLGATNPTRLLGPSGTAQRVVGEMRVASGQLLVGDVLVTLFPVGA